MLGNQLIALCLVFLFPPFGQRAPLPVYLSGGVQLETWGLI